MTLPITTRWRKSSYSNGMGGECVEVALSTQQIAVRDSKLRQGSSLSTSPPAWEDFLKAIQVGEQFGTPK
ncbi:DUF397 domain-containing protein [Streptomyces sp. NPDC050264]|uniref:DUF397 domain-containing protein n=1 Tax=Streptomyces sp. NPDC050264 TaxID=3155038 RepID=UPI00341D24FF